MQSSVVDISLNIIQRFNLTNDEVKELIKQLSIAIKDDGAKVMTEEEKWTKHYQDQIIKYGVLHPPKKIKKAV